MKQSRYPIALNISATSAVDMLLGLNEGRTRNFKVSDIVTLAVNSVTISAQDIVSESINIGLTSGNLQWNRIENVPVASSATSGILSINDYNRFSSTTTPNITSADVPTIPPSKILEDSNDRFVSDNQIAYWNSLSAGNVVVSAIDISETIGNLQWNRIENVPVATSNTNGTLTSADWNTFNNKASSSIIISGTSGLIGGGNLTSNVNFGLPLVGTPGTYTKITFDQYGREVSATNITSADIPTLSPSKILEDSNDRFVSDNQIAYWNSVSANLPLSGGNITGTLSANSINVNTFTNNKVLVSENNDIVESTISNIELSHLSNLSGNIQSQLDSLSHQSLSGTGAGTVNRIAKFITSSSVSDSSITDNGSLVTFSTPVSSTNNITAPTFTGLASTATSALQSDRLKTARTFSISGDVIANNLTFDGQQNIVLSANISNLSPTKIQTTSAYRFVTDTQITQWNNTSGTSAIIDLNNSLILEANKNKLYLLSGATTNVTSAIPSNTTFAQSLSPLFAGQREKIYTVVGPSSGTYQATVVFYGTSVNRENWVYPDNCIISTISNVIPSATGTFKNNFVVWGASLNVDSGTIQSPGISATVEV
jgi:hypothetical protein